MHLAISSYSNIANAVGILFLYVLGLWDYESGWGIQGIWRALEDKINEELKIASS
jgi:hypothetical protein